MWNQYFIPDQLCEALELLEHYRDRSCLIAGGTDLTLDFASHRYLYVEALVDISSIPEMRQITLENGIVRIGSAVTLSDILRSDILQSRVPVLVDAVRQIAGPQIRNIATIGGNVVNASPAADAIPALLALDGMVSITGPGGKSREIPLSKFLIGNRKVDLEIGEIVTGFEFALPDTGTLCYFRKVQPRRSMAIALINLAILLKVEANRIMDVRIAMGAVAPTAVRIKTVENELRNLPLSLARQPGLYAEVKQDISPISDFRAPHTYRLSVAERLLHEAMVGLLDRTGKYSPTESSYEA